MKYDQDARWLEPEPSPFAVTLSEDGWPWNRISWRFDFRALRWVPTRAVFPEFA